MTNTQTAVLFSQMTPPAELEAEFNDWYDEEHIPLRMRLPGFDSAMRYQATQPSARDYVAVYELSTLDALASEGFVGLRSGPSERTQRMLAAVDGFTRFACLQQSDVGESSPDDYLYVVAFDVPEKRADAYDEWYENEHTDMLMAADGWQRVRRFIVTESDGGPWTHLTFHYLSTLAALDSPERAAARAAPLRNRLSKEPWFGHSERWIYQPLSRFTDGAKDEVRSHG